MDTLGTYEDAIDIAAQMAGIEGKPRIVKERKRRSFWENMVGEAAGALSEQATALIDRPLLQYRMAAPR